MRRFFSMKALDLVMMRFWRSRWLDLRRSGTPQLLFDHILVIHRINGGQKAKIVGNVPGHGRGYSRQTARVQGSSCEPLPHQQGLRTKNPPSVTRQQADDLPQIQRGPRIMYEVNLLASMNLREKQELLDSVFDFMRKPCLTKAGALQSAKQHVDGEGTAG
jgi:hypothetical protein